MYRVMGLALAQTQTLTISIESGRQPGPWRTGRQHLMDIGPEAPILRTEVDAGREFQWNPAVVTLYQQAYWQDLSWEATNPGFE